MDSVVDSIVKKCFPCQIATPKPSHETLKMAPSQRRLLRSGWALCSCRDTWLPQVPWYWDCAFNCCQCCDSQVGPHICCLWCSWSRENWPRSLLQWAWVRTISWLSWFCIPKSHPLMTRGKWRNWKVHEVFWKGTSHHYKLEAINVSVSPQLSCHPSP